VQSGARRSKEAQGGAAVGNLPADKGTTSAHCTREWEHPHKLQLHKRPKIEREIEILWGKYNVMVCVCVCVCVCGLTFCTLGVLRLLLMCLFFTERASFTITAWKHNTVQMQGRVCE